MSFLKQNFDIDEILSDDDITNVNNNQETELVEKIKKMNIKSKVKFNHSIYGVLKKGEYKGREVEIREYYPGKVEVLVDKKNYISIGRVMRPGDKIMGCDVISLVEKSKDNIYKYLINCKRSVLFSKKSVKIDGDRVKITKGDMKGLYGKLIKDHKAKLLISFDVSGSRIMKFMDVEDIFYKDLLLDSGNYFQIDKIETIDGKYKIYGKERIPGKGDITKYIEMSNIKKYMFGVSFGNDIKTVDTRSEDEIEYVSEEIDKDIMGEGDEDSEEDMGDERGDEREYEREDEVDMVESYKDIERTEIITQQLSSIRRGYYDSIKLILDTFGESIDNINPYDIIEMIEFVIIEINKKLTDAKINFDISGSNVDIKMLIALLVAYEMQRNGLAFPGFRVYIRDLFNKNYFYVKLDDLMVSFFLRKDNTLFICELKKLRDFYKGKKYFNIVEELMMCFNGILKKMLNISVDLNSDKMEDIVPLEKVEPILKEYPRKMITFEDIIGDKISESARKIIWNPEYEIIVDDFKKSLKESVRLIEGEMKMEIDEKKINKMEEKRDLYEYVFDNLDVAPMVLNELGKGLIKVLSDIFIDFEDEYKKCDSLRIMCKDEVIRTYLGRFLGDKKGKSKMINEVEYLNMKRYYELSRIFNRLIDRINEKVKKPKEEMIEKKLKEKELQTERLIKRRKEVMKNIDEDELLEELENITLDTNLIGLKGIKKFRK